MTVIGGEPGDGNGLIGLLHRADWTRLSLSATVNDGSTVLVAPGRCYRYEAEGYRTGCDGGRPWEMASDDDYGDSVRWVSGPQAPLPRLLCPSWLLVASRLELRGRARACGRDALDVLVTPRPGLRGGAAVAGGLSGPVEVLVDAGTGILLRVAGPEGAGTEDDEPEDDEPEDDEPGVTELVRADFEPVIDPLQFAAPPGSRRAEGLGEALGAALGPAARAAKTAAGLAAGALGAWIRYAPTRRTRPGWHSAAELETAIPRDEPAPGLSPEGIPDGPPVGDDLLGLLHAGGTSRLTATLHQWLDIAGMALSVPGPARRAGFGGLGLLMGAIGGTAATSHLTSAVRIAGPGMYQIDRHGWERGPVTIARDGDRQWHVYADTITTGPAESLPGEIADLADPSWLLEWWLSGGTATTFGGRPAYRVAAARRPGEPALSGMTLFPVAVAVIDAKLGIIVRLTAYLGGRPVQRHELRDIGTEVGDFRVVLPPGLPVTEETGREWLRRR